MTEVKFPGQNRKKFPDPKAPVPPPGPKIHECECGQCQCGSFLYELKRIIKVVPMLAVGNDKPIYKALDITVCANCHSALPEYYTIGNQNYIGLPNALKYPSDRKPEECCETCGGGGIWHGATAGNKLCPECQGSGDKKVKEEPEGIPPHPYHKIKPIVNHEPEAGC